jgi:hypothetical protein
MNVVRSWECKWNRSHSLRTSTLWDWPTSWSCCFPSYGCERRISQSNIFDEPGGDKGKGVPGEAVTSVALLLTPAAPLLPPCCTCGRFAVSSFLGVLPPAFRGDDELATADCCVDRAIMDCSLTVATVSPVDNLRCPRSLAGFNGDRA